MANKASEHENSPNLKIAARKNLEGGTRKTLGEICEEIYKDDVQDLKPMDIAISLQ